MKLKNRLLEGNATRTTRADKPVVRDAQSSEQWLELKMRLHNQVIDKLDLRDMSGLDSDKMRVKLTPTVEQVVEAAPELQRYPEWREDLCAAVLDEIVGLGPLEPLFADAKITDILVNAPDEVFVERRGRLEIASVKFYDNKHVLNTVQRIVGRTGRRIDEASPMVDTRLPDGSRVNAIIPPASPDGPVLSIRRFSTDRLTPRDLVESGAASVMMMKYLAAAVQAKCNLLVSGGTGAGKTTLLNAISSFVPKEERLITVEDAIELQLMGAHVVRLEARPPNIEGRGEIPIRTLVRNALRMRPDRIIIGEVRGAEVLDMLQAMNTGHEGSMTTVHANSPDDAVGRLMMMLVLAGTALSGDSMAHFIGRSIRVIVQAERAPDGKRRISRIAEVVGFSAETVQTRDVFFFDSRHEGGRFVFTGRTMLADRFARFGVRFDPQATRS